MFRGKKYNFEDIRISSKDSILKPINPSQNTIAPLQMDKVELTTNSGTSEIPGNSENSGTSKTQDTSETPGTSGIYAKDNRSSFEIAYGTMDAPPRVKTDDKSKLFGGPRSSFFMAFNRTRDPGQINHAYQPDESDDDRESEGSDPECNSSSMGTEDNDSNIYSAGSLNGRSEEIETISNGRLPNGGRGFKVGFDAIEPQSSSPPMRRPQSKKKEKKSWDRFITESKSNFSEENTEFWTRVFVVTKILVIIVLFMLILATAVINKICFFIITANMFPPEANLEKLKLLKTANGTLVYNNMTTTNVMWIWSLILMIGAPYFFTFCRCLWKLAFQMAGRNTPKLTTFLLVMLTETIHSIGVNIMVFVVVPHLDPVSGVLFCLCIVMIPGCLNTVYPVEKLKQTVKESGTTNQCRQPGMSRCCSQVIGTFGAIGQIAALGLWCFHMHLTFTEKVDNIGFLICVIVAPILTSVSWWENYVSQGNRGSSGLPKLARNIRKCRTKLAFFSSIWKMCLTFIIPIGIFGINCEDGRHCIDTLYFQSDFAKISSGFGKTILESKKDFGSCNSHLPFIVAAVGILCSGICFKLCKVACKIMTQIVDMTIPLLLATPMAIGIILGMYSGFITTSRTGCDLPFPLWNTDEDLHTYFTTLTEGYELWIPILAGFAGYVSLILVTIHTWMPGKERLQTTDRLYVQPLYCGIFADQSLLMNRRREEKVRVTDSVTHQRQNVLSSLPVPEGTDEDMLSSEDIYRTQDTPFIYMCATMWHETEVEMTQLLKSIFRMDEDQCTRRHTQFILNRRDPDYYEFEAHIFFDDAFEKHKPEQYDFTVNEYVKMLIKNVRVSASSIHGMTFKLADPIKIPTPYGGRLVWHMPGNNKLIAHLKDKNRIRHRKRWSQVMYMYYFLAYQIFQKYSGRKLQRRADNTFLLALDGDVDFQPHAVQLLVDRMRKNADVGAACGRIHPIGNGAMVWYQKFEYAVSHWLQKAAEDKLGCVLCSPGCFSLFRGSALMDDNVMNKYTTPPSEPRHHVQYDQGEDRWLCTLLLQQGHRVEYCAASDALTYAPEGFYEFFNQRRRWTPSTMANIMDLLTDWKNVTKKNPEISLVYIFYQGLLMVSSILTPGTIFLMILGAINMAYPEVDLWVALLINAVPIAVLVLLCFCAKSDTQLLYSAILSTIYSLVMMIVMVGLLRQAATYGACSITTMFLVFVAGVFVSAAFIHPQEFWCIIHGFLYFLAIPSMSMVLMIYSLGNLNVVSWGTRENKTTAEVKDETETQKKLRGAMGFFTNCFGGRGNQKEMEDSKLRVILEKLYELENSVQHLSEHGSSRASLIPRTGSPFSQVSRPRTPMMMGQDETHQKFSDLSHNLEGNVQRENPIYEDVQIVRDPMVNPYWMEEDRDLAYFKRDDIPKEEADFWSELIEEYLRPIESNPEKEKEMQSELTELRNKVCLIFILINSLFIIVVFTLQQVVASEGSLAITLWCVEDGKDADAGQRIEPISVAFTLVFGILLFVQFICMLMHRIATLLHICAATELFKKKEKVDFTKMDAESGDQSEPRPETRELTYDDVYAMVKDMQKDQDADTASIASESSYAQSEVDEEEDAEIRRKEARKRWKKIARRRNKFQGNTLGANFRKNFIKLQDAIKNEDEDADSVDVDIDVKACSLQKQTQFSRFSKKSFHTLAYMTQDKGMKKVINSRQIRAQRRWHTAIEMTKLRNLNVGKDASKAMQNVVTAFVARKQSRETIMEENETLLEEPQPNTSGIRKFLTQENKNPNKNTRLETLQGPILEQPEDINDSVRDHKWEPPNYEEINQYEDIVKESRSNNNTGEQSSEEENKGSPTEVSYIDQFKVAYANENEENILEEDKANPDVINTNNGVEDSDDTIIDESSRL